MDNGLIGLIGLARKAGKAEVGEESVSIAAKAHKARLILLASDAGEHTRRHGERLGEQGNCPALPLPLTKADYKAEKTLRRRRQTRQREKDSKAAGRKPWAAPSGGRET